MLIKFWGVRGSIPTGCPAGDMNNKLKYILKESRHHCLETDQQIEQFIQGLSTELRHPVGHNTPCLEVTSGLDRVILDGGSGVRLLGLELNGTPDLSMVSLITAPEPTHGELTQSIAPPPDQVELTILFSHTHWDHIQGIPFFTPAYTPGNRIHCYAHSGTQLAEALALQQQAPTLFPISLEQMRAEMSFHDFPQEGLKVGEIEIKAMMMPHPGGSLAFRLSCGDSSMVYATDYEFLPEKTEQTELFRKFITGADVFISDSQYTFLESLSREGWGHSTALSAIYLTRDTHIKHLFLFHHDPEHSDSVLHDSVDEARAYYQMMNKEGTMKISLALEGTSLEI